MCRRSKECYHFYNDQKATTSQGTKKNTVGVILYIDIVPRIYPTCHDVHPIARANPVYIPFLWEHA